MLFTAQKICTNAYEQECKGATERQIIPTKNQVRAYLASLSSSVLQEQ